MKKTKVMSVILTGAIFVSTFTGCGNDANMPIKEETTNKQETKERQLNRDIVVSGNVFTVDDVEIRLLESKLHREGYFDDDDSNDGIARSDDEIEADAADYQAWWDEQIFVPGCRINKMPYVKNIGKTNAYVRIRFLIPSAYDFVTVVLNQKALANEFTFVGDWNEPAKTTIDGIEYKVYAFVHNEALKPGEMTYWNVWNTIGLSDTVSNEDIGTIFDENDESIFCILVQADAIKADYFDNAIEAFMKFDAIDNQQ